MHTALNPNQSQVSLVCLLLSYSPLPLGEINSPWHYFNINCAALCFFTLKRMMSNHQADTFFSTRSTDTHQHNMQMLATHTHTQAFLSIFALSCCASLFLPAAGPTTNAWLFLLDFQHHLNFAFRPSPKIARLINILCMCTQHMK